VPDPLEYVTPRIPGLGPQPKPPTVGATGPVGASGASGATGAKGAKQKAGKKKG
jgi:hypothetical protein